MKESETRARLYRVIKTCLGLKKEERALIAYTKEREYEAFLLSNVVNEFSNNTSLSKIGSKIDRETEKEMFSADATIFCIDEILTEKLGHSYQREKACNLGKRVAFLLDSYDVSPSRKDIALIRSRAEELSSELSKEGTISIISRSGGKEYELTIPKDKCFPLAIIPDITRPGSWGAIPDYAELSLIPRIGLAEGKAFIDCGITGYGKLETVLSIKRGRIVDCSGSQRMSIKSILKSERNIEVVSEVGIGLSHIMTENKWVFSMKKNLGYVHIGVGSNEKIGGELSSSSHLDFVISKCKVLFNGKELRIKKIGGLARYKPWYGYF